MNIKDIWKKAQEMGGQMKSLNMARKALEKAEFTSESAGGKIKIVMNGRLQVISLSLDSKFLKSEESKNIEQALSFGINNVIEKAQKSMQKTMKTLMAGGGSSLPS